MRTGSSLLSLWLAVTLAFLIGLPRLAVGQVDSMVSPASPSVATPMPDPYTFFQSLSGQWSNGSNFYEFTPGANVIRLDSRNARGAYADPLFIKKKGDVVKFYGKRVVPFDGGYMIGDWVAYIPLSPNEFKIRRGKVIGGAFVEVSSDFPITVGTYRRLNTAQAQAFIQSSEVIRAQRIRDDSNSGLAGALAAGLGAALAGGNAEQVMGMAMKGAELTTDNEMSRNVLAGQGDAMVAAGTQRMIDESAPGDGAAVAGASSSAGDRSGGIGAASDGATAAVGTVVQSTSDTGSIRPQSNKSNADCKETRVAAGYTSAPNFDESLARAEVDRWAGTHCGQDGVVCGASSCGGLNVQGDPRLPKQISYTCGIDATKPYRSCGASSVSAQ